MIPYSSLLRRACSGFAVFALISASTSGLKAAGASGPTVTVNEPVAVTVAGPVEVEGYVEVLNDALKTPFNKRISAQMEVNLINAFASLPAIPAGKRLVIEAIGVTAYVAVGTKATAFLNVNGLVETNNSLSVPIPLTDQGAFGLTPRQHFMGLHKMRIVLDPRFHNSPQFNVFRSATGDVADVTCTIIGYLEDVPAAP